MRTVDWTSPSIVDLSNIRAWLITNASADSALRVLGEIRQQADRLQAFASRGSELPSARRKLSVRGTNYIIVYRVTKTSVEVLRVHHNRQNWRPPE